MTEYIERNEAIEAVKHAWAKDIEPTQYIKVITAANVAPVRHGKWEEYMPILGSRDLQIHCTECGMTNNEKTPFCPQCGAKMQED